MNWSHMWPERLTVKSARNCLFSLFKQKWIVLMNEESLMNYHMTCQWFFSISSRESFHLSFVWLQLLKNNGRSWWPRQHLTLWPSRGWMCLRWAQEKGRVGWGSPQISKTLPCSCLSPWRWKATFNESTGWHLGTSSVVSRVHTFYGCSTVIGGHIGNSRCPGQGQWVKNLGDVKGEEGWLLEPELWKEQEGTREPHQGHQREPENHHKQSWEGNLLPSCPARTAQELGWARALCGHGLSRATVSIRSDLTLGRLQPWPLFRALVDISGPSFPVSIPLPALSPSGFCGTGPSPNSWSGLWHRPVGTRGAQV